MAVALAYFTYLAGIAMFRRSVPARRRAGVVVVSLITMATVTLVGGVFLMPVVYLLLGYWLPALLVTGPNEALGRRLLAFDRRLFGRCGLANFTARAPRLVVGYLEFSYLLCYAVVPVGWAWLVLAGHRHQSDAFWTTVLLAAFVCYGALPWLPSLAPRALEPSSAPASSLIRKMNGHVLDRASVHWNTFPSGHAAASVAVALALGAHVPTAGAVLGIVAVSIAIGSVVGRYHYAADAIAGAVVAIVAFAMSSAAHGL